MKSMKKLVAALLVLTLVLALTGTAMAGCKFKAGDPVKFIKNVNLYDDHHDSDKTGTIVRKGSQTLVVATYASSWVQVYMTDPNEYESAAGATKTLWVKADALKKASKPAEVKVGTLKLYTWFNMVFSDKGVNGSDWAIKNIPDATDAWCEGFGYVLKDGKKQPVVYNGPRISADCYKHVKATGKVWLHKEPCLKKSYGKALHSGDIVKYLRYWGFDNRVTAFYKVRYEGKNLWVSAEYTKLVK